MKLKLFAVKDLITAQHASPFTSLSEPTARRQVRDHCSSNRDHNWVKYPSDFELWEIGEYDDETAALLSTVPRRCGSISQIVPELRARDAGVL